MSRVELVQAFTGFPARFAAAARAADPRLVQDGDWGPSEIARHLIAVEHEVWQTRFATLLAEDEPQWSWTEPGLEPGLDDAPLDDILARHADARARSVSILEAFDQAAWARTGVHATYGRLDIDGLLRIATDHDAEHLDGLGARP